MGQFTYIGPGMRVYPDITVQGSVLLAESGKVYDLNADPGDGLWTDMNTTSAKVAAPDTSATGVSTPESSQGTGDDSDLSDASAVTNPPEGSEQ